MPKETAATRKRIIDTAERLFAEQGVDNTSLLDIAKAAQQKNRSALQYHFTNKQGLLDAVLDKHAGRIAVHRTAMLDTLEASGDFTLYQLIEALVLPMAALLDEEDGGHAFLKIHSQLMASQNYGELRARRDNKSPETQRIQALMMKHTSSKNPEILGARMLLTGIILVHGLADYLAHASAISRPEFLHTMIQGIVDLLQQPPLPERPDGR